MRVESIRLVNFKRLADTTVPLRPVTVLIGGNNSGKSCVLQGAHLGITLLQTTVREASLTFSPDKLRYSPTNDFLDLAHGQRLTEGIAIAFVYALRSDAGESEPFEVKLQRAENSAAHVTYSENHAASDRLSDSSAPFSVYVPGLAGIPHREEYRSNAIVDNGIARGDANLYLRNVLWRIHRDNRKRDTLQSNIQRIFPGIELRVTFDEENDLFLDARIAEGGVELPLDMAGTGVLQSLQLMAYVVNYGPSLLLLDEPDAHLHPDNQRLIAKTLGLVAEETKTQVVLATHSRTMLDAFQEDPNALFVWMKNGGVQPESDKNKLSILMDLRALDRGEEFYQGHYRIVLWTEDQDLDYLKVLLSANDINIDEVYFYSYETSSKLDSAMMLAKLVTEIRPGVCVVVHRDGDFMTADERTKVGDLYARSAPGIFLFITEGPDVEHYFASPRHIAASTGMSEEDSLALVQSAIAENVVLLAGKFRNKREQIRTTLYRENRHEFPSTDDLIPRGSVPFQSASGKDLLRAVAAKLQERGHRKAELLQPLPTLRSERLGALRLTLRERRE